MSSTNPATEPSRERCQALIDMTSEFQNAVTTGSRGATAANMLQFLHDFAQELYEFFNTGFSKTAPRLEESKNITPDYVFGLLSDQVSYDLDAILRAYTQRNIVEALKDTKNPISDKGEHLKIADALAFEILEPAKVVGLVPSESTVLTYFQKDLRIRLMPYAPVAFVGLPFSAFKVPQDYVALAHEIGHYVYHRGVQSPDRQHPVSVFISYYSKAPLPWYFHWLEELFADVFGCIIAGPAIAASFQDLSLQYTRDESVLDDQRHPAPVLRPYIYIDALNALAEVPGLDNAGLKQVAGGLAINWREKAKWLPQEITVRSRPTPSSSCVTDLNVEEARTQLKDVIKYLVSTTFEGLVRQVNSGSYDFQKVWGKPNGWESAANTNFDALKTLDVDKSDLNTSFTQPNSLFSDKMTGYGKRTNKLVQENEWLEVLTFGGWIEQGPGGGIAHG